MGNLFAYDAVMLDEDLARRGWLRLVVERSATERTTTLIAVKPNRRHATLTVSDAHIEDNPSVSMDDLLDLLGTMPDQDSYREQP
jgi:hypothetical protein